MNGIHDIGGMHGLGPVVAEDNEPPFHAPWEGRVHGIAVSCQVSGVNPLALQRSTIENMPTAMYLNTTYYEKWLYAYEKILNDAGVVTTAEIDARVAAQAPGRLAPHPVEPQSPSDFAKKIKSVIYGGTPHDRPLARPRAFQPGDLVRTRNRTPLAHTRLPGFVRDKVGIIETYHGAHCIQEAHLEGLGDVPDHLYAVKFSSTTLWGPDAEDEKTVVYVDLFENYLERA